MSISDSSLPPSPSHCKQEHEQKDAIGTTHLATIDDLYSYIHANEREIDDYIEKEVQSIKETINRGLQCITKFPYVLQLCIPRNAYGQRAWKRVETDIYNDMQWGDNVRIIPQDDWFVFIIIDAPSQTF